MQRKVVLSFCQVLIYVGIEQYFVLFLSQTATHVDTFNSLHWAWPKHATFYSAESWEIWSDMFDIAK